MTIMWRHSSGANDTIALGGFRIGVDRAAG